MVKLILRFQRIADGEASQKTVSWPSFSAVKALAALDAVR
jgi:hypothetical protein